MDNNPESAFTEVETKESEAKQADSPEEAFKKEQDQITQVFSEIVDTASQIIKVMPERAKKEGPRRLMEVAKRMTIKDLEKEGLTLNAEQLVAIDELVEGIVVRHENKESEVPKKEVKTTTTLLTSESSPEDRMDYLRKAYLSEGGITKLGEMAIKKMNMENTSSNKGLVHTLAVNTRRELGVNSNLRVKITPQDLIAALEK